MQVKPNQGIILCLQHKGACTCSTLHFISPQTTSGCTPHILVFLIACLGSASWPLISFLGFLVPVFFSGVHKVFLWFMLVMVFYRTSAQYAQMFWSLGLCSFIAVHFSTRILISSDWVPMKPFQSKGYTLANVHQRFKNRMMWWK